MTVPFAGPAATDLAGGGRDSGRSPSRLTDGGRRRRRRQTEGWRRRQRRRKRWKATRDWKGSDDDGGGAVIIPDTTGDTGGKISKSQRHPLIQMREAKEGGFALRRRMARLSIEAPHRRHPHLIIRQKKRAPSSSPPHAATCAQRMAFRTSLPPSVRQLGAGGGIGHRDRR